jgi:hypothetical protein
MWEHGGCLESVQQEYCPYKEGDVVDLTTATPPGSAAMRHFKL